MITEVDVFDENLREEDFRSPASGTSVLGIYAIDIACNTLSLARPTPYLAEGAIDDFSSYVGASDRFLTDFFTEMRELQSGDLEDIFSFTFYSIREIKAVVERFLLSPNPQTWVTIMHGLLLGF